jgi:hypothetical protein
VTSQRLYITKGLSVVRICRTAIISFFSSWATTSIEGVMFHKGKLAEEKPTRQQNKLRWNVLLEDLRLLASVGLAHFIVWRTVRRRYSENSARRSEFKLLRGKESLAQPEPQVVRGLDWPANTVANGNRNLRPERKARR